MARILVEEAGSPVSALNPFTLRVLFSESSIRQAQLTAELEAPNEPDASVMSRLKAVFAFRKRPSSSMPSTPTSEVRLAAVVSDAVSKASELGSPTAAPVVVRYQFFGGGLCGCVVVWLCGCVVAGLRVAGFRLRVAGCGSWVVGRGCHRCVR